MPFFSSGLPEEYPLQIYQPKFDKNKVNIYYLIYLNKLKIDIEKFFYKKVCFDSSKRFGVNTKSGKELINKYTNHKTL
tara:strand:+ start:1694 stop:1927 length:234 start_codon:yes stop_codon:yes gene_type:complete